jgi:hypothetical protein
MIEAVAARSNLSPTSLWITCAVIVVSLGAWLGAVFLAARTPHIRHRQVPHMQSPVLGGMHEAEGGRSVAPTRDAPATIPQVPEQHQPEQREPERPAASVGDRQRR